MYNSDGTFSYVPSNSPCAHLLENLPLIQGSQLNEYVGQRVRMLVSYFRDRRTSFLVMAPDGHLVLAMKRDVNSHAENRAPHSRHEIVGLVINRERFMLESMSALEPGDRRFEDAQGRALERMDSWARGRAHHQLALLSTPLHSD
ncbi:hypothetical protein C8R47DRAFT_1084764 [Mycena vitilis]|nr:hypothetical protein C8R47DRAFT_1084764 [Mycena vitilis]